MQNCMMMILNVVGACSNLSNHFPYCSDSATAILKAKNMVSQPDAFVCCLLLLFACLL